MENANQFGTRQLINEASQAMSAHAQYLVLPERMEKRTYILLGKILLVWAEIVI